LLLDEGTAFHPHMGGRAPGDEIVRVSPKATLIGSREKVGAGEKVPKEESEEFGQTCAETTHQHKKFELRPKLRKRGGARGLERETNGPRRILQKTGKGWGGGDRKRKVPLVMGE